MGEAELDALNGVVRRLLDEFTDVDPAAVASLVAAEHRRYADRPVRDFVPVFVERAVRESLRGGAAPSAQRDLTPVPEARLSTTV